MARSARDGFTESEVDELRRIAHKLLRSIDENNAPLFSVEECVMAYLTQVPNNQSQLPTDEEVAEREADPSPARGVSGLVGVVPSKGPFPKKGGFLLQIKLGDIKRGA